MVFSVMSCHVDESVHGRMPGVGIRALLVPIMLSSSLHPFVRGLDVLVPPLAVPFCSKPPKHRSSLEGFTFGMSSSPCS